MSEQGSWTDDLRSYVRAMVRGGFVEVGGIAEGATETFEDEAPDEEIAALAEKLVEKELAEVLAESATWEHPTDNERLETAFAALEREGVVARQDFWCCNTCGHSAMPEEMDGAGAMHGYTFFHNQDTESAVEGGGLMLAYGARGSREDADIAAVGERVRRALQAAGLTVEWSGSSGDRLFVPMTWRRLPLRD